MQVVCILVGILSLVLALYFAFFTFDPSNSFSVLWAFGVAASGILTFTLFCALGTIIELLKDLVAQGRRAEAEAKELRSERKEPRLKMDS